MSEMKTLTLNGKTYDSFADKTAREALKQLEQNGVTNEQMEQAVDKYLEAHPVSGLSSTEKNLLLSLFRKTVYTDNMSVTIAQLENLWAGGEEPDIPDVPVVAKYTITNELVNVKSSNSTSSVNEGASYTATLTVDEGYEISNVTVTMGGVDVTASVYANGVITISSVTGNVEIMASAVEAEKPAELPEDGLCDFFNLGGATAETLSNGEQGFSGSGGGYIKGVAAGTTNEQYGTTANLEYYTDEAWDQNITVCTLTYCHTGGKNMFGWWPFLKANNQATVINPNGFDADGNAVWGQSASIQHSNGYNVLIISISETEFKAYVNGRLVCTQLASDIENFARWNNTKQLRSGWAQSYCSAVAIYNKTLTEVEAVEVTEYLKTLEVTA